MTILPICHISLNYSTFLQISLHHTCQLGHTNRADTFEGKNLHDLKTNNGLCKIIDKFKFQIHILHIWWNKKLQKEIHVIYIHFKEFFSYIHKPFLFLKGRPFEVLEKSP